MADNWTAAPPAGGYPPNYFKANGVYYPNWHIYKGRAPSSLPLGMISHIFYAFAHVKEDGTVFLSDEWADLQMDVDGTKGCLNAMKALKGSHPHLKTIISIGGGAASQNFASVAADANKRANFARTAHAMLVQHGLDGLDIDWEHPSNPTEGHHYLLLLQTIRQFLPEHTYILTSALPATKWHLQHIPLAQCAQYLNFLNLMTYDFFGPWSERTGHHSQLYPHPSEPDAPSCNTAIEYLTRPPHNIPPHKILLGVPTYGRSFIGAHAPGMKFTGHAGEEGTFECQDLPRPGSNVIRDRERGTISCVGGDAGYVGYEDGETVRGKGVWSRKRGLGGMFYWTGHGGNGLVEEGFRGLHGG
ncbi:glycoside hydrolase [Ascobolus immersus RN42]|uniref:chitinase n=1 Tax=Ascobolus immersus RN42 TaxID=1160509 RepID=A0A3N4HW58_ASCIM|nr:glycoside hydrolase [Ascobolus immersus RN42]